MANLTIDDYKRLALQQAALQGPQGIPAGIAAPAPDFVPPVAPQAQQMAAPMPNIAAPPAPNVQPQTASVTDVQPRQGPIKSFLSSFLQGAGNGMLAHAGLETTDQRQQRLFNQVQQVQQGQRAQQAANDTTAYRQAQIGGLEAKAAQLDQQNAPFTIPNDPSIPAALRGKVTTAGNWNALSKVLAQNSGRLDNTNARNEGNMDVAQLKYGDGEKPGPLNTQIKDIGGRSLLLRKGTGEVLKDLGQSNAITTAGARAQAMAAYGLVNTMDEEGNPVGISRLNALQQGTPTASFDALKGIASDRVGIAQYADILDNKISPNLKVLNDSKQRAIIAHTLAEAEKNPGAIQSLITSGLQSGLSPQGAALAAGIMQGREFGGVARKYGGNMNGTEGLMNRIMSNQASPLNSESLNRELIQNDRDFTRKANKTLTGITGHSAKGAAKPNTPDSSIPEYVRGADGRLVRK